MELKLTCRVRVNEERGGEECYVSGMIEMIRVNTKERREKIGELGFTRGMGQLE